jgi:hypothetical protein
MTLIVASRVATVLELVSAGPPCARIPLHTTLCESSLTVAVTSRDQ